VTELQALADGAFRANRLAEAEAYFLAFERDFGAEAQVKEIVDRNKALIAICMIANRKPAEARPYIEAALAMPPGLVPLEVRQELAFWMAVFLMQDGEFRVAQEAFGKFFAVPEFSVAKRMESLLLFGTCYVTLGYHRTAAEFFGHQIPNLRRIPGGAEHAGRAVVLRMTALLESGQTDAALGLLREEYPRMGEITQLVSFQTLALQLGARLLEEQRYHEAIACLQRVWGRERLLAHQEAKLAALRARRDELARDPRFTSAWTQTDGMIRRVERELENFRNVEEFDAALRFRLAMAFQGLERYREAALILEDMLRTMEPTPVVQTASLAVIQSWMQLGRWPKALEAAENYLVAFGDQENHPSLPQVMFLQADALQKLERVAEANAVFGSVVSLFPKCPIRPQALFMQGFTDLLLEANESAVRRFDQLLAEHPEDATAQDADYWKGMALSFQQEYVASREHLAGYLKRHEKAGVRYETEAKFRMAYATFCEADYEGAVREFEAFLGAYGDAAPDADEARLLLGDALLGLGRAEEGMAAYRSIRPRSTRFFEEGWFKLGTALKLLEDFPGLRAHYEDFLEKYPDSQRMPEAVHWIGFAHVKEGHPDLAKEISWRTLERHGDRPELFAVEELLLALPKVYRKDGPDGLTRLRDEVRRRQAEAEAAKQATLRLRLLWLEAELARGSDPVLADGLLAQAGRLVDPEVHNPQLIADAADAARRRGNTATAEKLYTELRRWHPKSLHLPRAYAGLGHLAADAGKREEAIRNFAEYERRAFSAVDLPDILLRQGGLFLEDGKPQLAEKAYLRVLESPAAGSEHKARALLGLGDLHVAGKEPEKAAACYERVYVAYGKSPGLVAQAYWKRGQALETLQRPEAAWEVYQELAGRQDLLGTAESRQGRQRAEALAAFAPAPAGKEAAP
jgi:tetratricopeptide (TPR) repeat protein